MEQLVQRPTSEFPAFVARGFDRGTFYAASVSYSGERGVQVSSILERTIDEVRGDWAGDIQRRLVGASGVYLRSQIMLGDRLGHLPILELQTDEKSFNSDRAQLLWVLGQLEAPSGVIAQAGNRWQYVSPQIISEIGFTRWIKNITALAGALPQLDPNWLTQAQAEYAAQLRLTCGRGLGIPSKVEAPYEIAFGSKVNSAQKYDYFWSD